MGTQNIHFCNAAVSLGHIFRTQGFEILESEVATLYAHAQMIPFGVRNAVSGIEGEGFQAVCFPSVTCSAASLVGIIGTDGTSGPMGYRIPAGTPFLGIRTHQGCISGGT